MPEPAPGFVFAGGADEQVERLAGISEQVRGDMRTDVSGAAGEEDGHDFRVSGRLSRVIASDAGGARFGARRKRHATPRASFHGTSFNQRIAPLAQRRN